MINLPLNKLNQIAKSRSIKGYKNKSKENLSESKPKITLFLFFFFFKDIKKDFSELRHSLKHRFSK